MIILFVYLANVKKKCALQRASTQTQTSKLTAIVNMKVVVKISRSNLLLKFVIMIISMVKRIFMGMVEIAFIRKLIQITVHYSRSMAIATIIIMITITIRKITVTTRFVGEMKIIMIIMAT